MVAEHASKKNSGYTRPEVSADWEDAFQAEDFLISPDTEPGTLFEDRATLKAEALPTSRGRRQTASGAAAVKKAASTAAVPGKKRRRSMPSLLLTVFESVGNHAWFFPLQRFPGGLGRRFSLLAPVKRGVVLMLAAILLLGASAIFFVSVRGGPVSEENITLAQKAEKKVPEASPATEGGNEAAPVAIEAGVEASPPVAAGQAGMRNLDRQKWRFSSFMIDAGFDEAGKPSYVVVDLSLVLRMKPGEDFPNDKEYAIRNMIYQFFSNRPPYELRRFSLARGEMKQKLLAWFNKEWPENKVESILFHRYQII